MALDFDTSHQYSLPVRWGDLFGGINEANTFSSSTIATRANNLSADFLTVAQQGDVIDGLYGQYTNVQGDLGDWTDYLFGLTETTLKAMCRDDTARPRTDDLTGWFDKVNRDMLSADKKWTIPTVTSSVALPGTNIGTGYLMASVVEPVDGLATYYAYSEVIRLECTSDSYSGGATAGSEEFSVWGETSVDKTDMNWPKGSGAETTLTVVDTSTDSILTDGALEEWTLVSSGPDLYRPTDWTRYGATSTATLAKETSIIYGDGGLAAAKFTGDGSTVLGMYQDITDNVEANKNYAISFWYRTTSATYTAKLRVALVDGSGTAVTDNAGNSQVDATVDETALGAANGTWVRAGIVLRTPRNLPTDSLNLEFRFPSGDVLDNTKSVYIDHVVMSEMEQVYDGGPYLAIHSGAVPFALKDAFTDTIANDKTTTNFVRCLDRAFDLATNGIRLTVTGTTAISDGLIT